MTTTPHPPSPLQPIDRTGPGPIRRPGVRGATLLTSMLITALGLAWWFGDAFWYFDGDGDRATTSLLALVPHGVDASLAVLLGLIGIVTARWGGGRTVLAVGVVQAIVFAVLAGDLGVLILLGYLTALIFPFVLLAALLRGAAHDAAARIGLAGVLLVGGTAVVASGAFDAAALRNLGSGLESGLRDAVLPHLVVTLFVAHGLLWAAVAVRAARSVRGTCVSCGRPGGGHFVLRWRVPVTLLAAACALPYGLVRLTWLTGMPFAMDNGDLDAEPGVRIMGLMLGLAGLLGATLTIGLLRPWGRVFPRWIPRIGGRDVPVLFPTLTAGVVGAVMAIAGRSMLQSVLHGMESDEAVYLVLLPLPLWGPALMLAAWAYYLRARGTCGSCG